MKTIVLQKNNIGRAVEELIGGGVVAFPTETVYGLGGNAFCAPAIQKIFDAKGRPADNPLIVHCQSVPQARGLVGKWNEDTQRIADAFWPGPLTMILPKSPAVPDAVTAGLGSVGVRVPGNALALQLIARCGFPLAAPSANRSGHPSPTQAQHVYRDLQGRIPYIIDGGSTVYGLESTVLDCAGAGFRILRPGSVTQEALERVLRRPVEIDPAVLTEADVERAASPGMKYRHYAPQTYHLILVEGSSAFLERLYDRYTKEQKRVMILSMGQELPGKATLVLGEDMQAVAGKLYATLIELENKADIVLCPVVAQTGVGLAVMNRLLRAAGFVVLKEGEQDV